MSRVLRVLPFFLLETFSLGNYVWVSRVLRVLPFFIA